MNDRFFLDTNVLVYCFDDTAPGKRKRAMELVRQALGGDGAISYQVVQEFLNVALRKFTRPLSSAEAREYLDRVLLPLCRVHSEPALYRDAIALRDRWGLSFYDALIVAGALRGAARTLYSEDLQDGLTIGELTVVNPFRSG